MSTDYTPKEGKILRLFIKYADAAQPKIEKLLGVQFEYYITIKEIMIGAGADKKNKIIYVGKKGLVGAYDACEGRKSFCFKFVTRFVMLHEALHIAGMSHDKAGRMLGYRSDLTKDIYTRNLMRKLFKYTKEELPD